MQPNAPFCVLLKKKTPPPPPTAFSLSRVGMYAISIYVYYNPSKFIMDNAWTSKPTCANMTLEIPTSNKHRTSDAF